MKQLDNLRRTIGQRIKDRRKELGFSNQSALAAKIGTDQSRVSRWESGEEMPDNQYRELITSVLGPEVFSDEPVTRQNVSSAIQLLSAYQDSDQHSQSIALFLLSGDPNHAPTSLPAPVQSALAALLESLKSSR